MIRAITTLVLAGVLAGCLNPSSLVGSVLPIALDEAALPDASLADWAHRALPFGGAHNHSDPAHHHGLSTHNFEVLGWNPLETEYAEGTAGGYFCGEITRREGERAVAYVHSYTTPVAFVGVDVTDPANPTKISEFALPRHTVYDLSVTPDGAYVILGINLKRPATPSLSPSALPLAELRAGLPDARCRGESGPSAVVDETPYPSGLLLVDVRDPLAPRVVDHAPLAAVNVHSVFATEVEGRQLVLASVVNVVHAASHFVFFEIEGEALAHKYTYRPAPGPIVRTPTTNGHVDGTIQVHPVTGQLLAYLADWNGGFVLLDITDYTAAREVSRWSDHRFGDRIYETGAIHGAHPMETLWDGRHYTLVGQEMPARPVDAPTGKVYVLDTTDPANPTWVSGWTLPVDVVWTKSLLFSTHYPIVVDRMMFLGMYHGGLWAVDLSDPASPRTAGVFLPDRVSPTPPPSNARLGGFSPAVLEVLPLPNGDLVTFDASSGAYTLRFDRSLVLPPVVEWPVLEPASN